MLACSSYLRGGPCATYHVSCALPLSVMSLSSHRLDELDAFLLELNEASGTAILPLFRGDFEITAKSAPGFDPVTNADRNAEAAIRQRIAERYPQHGVVGEEYGEDRPSAEFVWVIDPIDGTSAFVAGLPLWTTLIGLRFQGRPVLGSIGQPFLGEVFIGHAGGSRLVSARGVTRLKVRACRRLADAIVSATDPDGFDVAERGAWSLVRAAARLARFGCDAYAYAMIAHGMMDLVVESDLQCWDVEAAIPVVEGAGGVLTDWHGRPVGHQGGQIVIAGDRACHEEALELLCKAAK